MDWNRGYSPPLQRRGEGWFGQHPRRIVLEIDRTTPNPSFATQWNTHDSNSFIPDRARTRPESGRFIGVPGESKCDAGFCITGHRPSTTIAQPVDRVSMTARFHSFEL